MSANPCLSGVAPTCGSVVRAVAVVLLIAAVACGVEEVI
jgi:hypothetical protein